MLVDTARLQSHYQASVRKAFVSTTTTLWRTTVAAGGLSGLRGRHALLLVAATPPSDFEPEHASSSPPQYIGRGRIRQGFQGHKRQEPQPNGSGNADWTEGVRLSLFSPFQNLPPDGKIITDEEEACDPYHGNCKTAMNVWESKCRVCSGTGSCVSNSGRRRTLHTCLMCHGIGFVRRSSATLLPEMGNGKNQTLGRAANPSADSNSTSDTEKSTKRQTKSYQNKRADPSHASAKGDQVSQAA